jgi:ABC-type branched-subunit amino acid transport system ATPase component
MSTAAATAATAQPLLQARGLHKNFGGVKAVSDISFDVPAGSIFAVIGPNGAGKSTLLNLISGLYSPNAGSLSFKGADLSRMPAHRRVRLGIARTFQKIRLFKQLSVLENVIAGFHIHHSIPAWQYVVHGAVFDEDQRRCREQAVKLLDFVGMAARMHVQAGSLSYGEQRMLELARALATKPQLLLIDEPAAGLNAAEVDSLLDRIRSLRNGGTPVVLVEHNMDLVMNVADRHGHGLWAAPVRRRSGGGAEEPGGHCGLSRRRIVVSALLEVDRLELAYGPVAVCRDISLRLDRGEIVALIGANGAGKSTTLRAIAGVLPPRRGTIRFSGQDVTATPSYERSKLGIALVPEGRHVFPFLTVRENLELGGFNVRNDAAKVRQRMDGVFAMFPRLSERSSQNAGTLSGGEQQMLVLGRAMMSEPQLLCLDEPSLGLAPIVVQDIFQKIKAINAAGTSVLLVEQNARYAFETASRGYVLQTGSVIASGSCAELKLNPRVQEAYLGRIAAAAVS